jgi:hypothetical protein
MFKILTATALALVLSGGSALAQENGGSGNGQNWFERCTPETIVELANLIDRLPDTAPRKVLMQKRAHNCMLRLQRAMQRIR